MKYTRNKVNEVNSIVSSVKYRFNAKKLHNFAMTPDVQGSGTNSIEKQMSGLRSNVIKESGNLDTFRNIQKENRINEQYLIRKKMKDKKKIVKPPILPESLKHSINSEANNAISPLI